jgi:V8-like Glu-specific endopeptidase
LTDREKTAAFATQTYPLEIPLSLPSSDANGIKWRGRIRLDGNVTSPSLHFRTRQSDPKVSWRVKFLVSNKLEDLVSNDSTRGREGEGWTEELSSNVIEVVVETKAKDDSLSLVIDMYDVPAEQPTPQGLFADKLMSVDEVPNNIKGLVQPVVRLRIKTAHGEARCSGFLISESLLLTNYYCISTSIDVANTLVDFDYNKSGRPQKATRLRKLELVNSDTAFDYSVVRIEGTGHPKYHYVSMFREARKDFQGLSPDLVLIGHPKGGPKMVSLVGCVQATEKAFGGDGDQATDFGHHCDTLGGSSGSPVFSKDQFELVGLHHAGYEEGAKPSDSLKNQAVYIGYILRDISNHAPSIYSEILAAGKRQ